jgi:hypothetical protein
MKSHLIILFAIVMFSLADFAMAAAADDSPSAEAVFYVT